MRFLFISIVTMFVSLSSYAHQPVEWDQIMDFSSEKIKGDEFMSIGPDGCWFTAKNYKVALHLHPTQRVLATYGEKNDKCSVLKFWKNTNVYLLEMDLSPDEGVCTIQIIDRSGSTSNLNLTCSPG